MDNSEKSRSKLKFCYDQEGKLLRYPAKKDLRRAVLAGISAQFQEGRDYTEKEVNAIIAAQLAFSDVELIRRELYEARFLNRLRDGSKYWKEPVSP